MPWSMKKRRPIVAPGWISMPVSQRATDGAEPRQPAQAMAPQPVVDAMQDQGVQARIAGQHLPGERAAGSRSKTQAMSSRKAIVHWNLLRY
jgi:hypothetical protein